MRHFIERLVCRNYTNKEDAIMNLMNAIASEEFALLYVAQRGACAPAKADLGLGDNVNDLWRKTMGTFTDFATALVAALKTNNGTVDQTHLASLDAAVASLQTDDAATKAAEGTDAANIAAVQADLAAGLKVLQDGVPTAPPATPPAA